MTEQGGDAAAKSCAGPKQDEQKEAEHGGRKHQGQRGQSLEAGEPASAAQDQQSRKRNGDGQQNGRGDRRQAEGEGERLPVHHA